MPDRTLLLDAVRESSEASTAARQRFITAVTQAHEAGLTNRTIGMSAGLSEGGIRMLLKRAST